MFINVKYSVQWKFPNSHLHTDLFHRALFSRQWTEHLYKLILLIIIIFFFGYRDSSTENDALFLTRSIKEDILKNFSSFCPWNESQWVQNSTGPQWLSLYGQKRRDILQNYSYSFMFHSRKIVIHVWNNMMASKLWQNLYFWVNYPFNLCEHYHKLITE